MYTAAGYITLVVFLCDLVAAILVFSAGTEMCPLLLMTETFHTDR